MVQDTKVEDAAAAPSKEAETPIDVDAEIKENMGAGKKHLLCGDYPEAVTCFQEACTHLSNKHGQMAEECSDAYYYYGVSLLELARLENGVLGNALKGVPDEDEESDKESEEQFEKAELPEGEREKLREEVEAAMATEDEDTQEEDEGEESEKKEKAEVAEKEEKPAAKEDDKKEEVKKPAEDAAEPETKSEKEAKPEKPETAEMETADPSSSKSDTDKGQDCEDEDPDDISNMQLAWEMLELAKVLYKKREKSKANSLLIAQCHLKLGELGLEVENYPQAIGDFLECLLMQKEFLPETDRKLAETYYNLGLAYSFEKRFDNALEHYQNALNVLEARVELLEELIDNQEGVAEKESETLAECKEIGEIKELIPDINSKIEDVLLIKKQTQSKLEGSPFRQTAGETSTGFGASSSQDKTCSKVPVRKVAPSSGSPTSNTKEAPSDISHLVRRKRPSPDEDNPSTEMDSDPKKAKQEANGNKENEANGSAQKESTNGSTKTPEKTDDKEEDKAAALKKLAAAGDAPVAMET